MKHHIRLVISILTVLILAANITCQGVDLTNRVPNSEAQSINVNPKTFWGDMTNFLRGDHFGGKSLPTILRSAINVNNGVIIISGNPLKTIDPAELCIKNIIGSLTTNSSISMSNIVLAYMPPFNEALVLAMTDSNNVPVPNTREGLLLGSPLDLKPNTRWINLPRAGSGQPGAMSLWPGEQQGIWSPTWPKECREFDPLYFFKIKKPGLYKLTVMLRLYVEDTNTYLKAIALPPVTVDVLVR